MVVIPLFFFFFKEQYLSIISLYFYYLVFLFVVPVMIPVAKWLISGWAHE